MGLPPLAELLGVSVTELLLCCRDAAPDPESAEAAVRAALTYGEELPRVWREKGRWRLLFLLSALLLARMGRLTGSTALAPGFDGGFGAYFPFRAPLRLRAALFHSPLICTSGQPTAAVIRLLDMLADAGTGLYYAGDFDGEGLSIALQLLTHYPNHLHLWHMTEMDYMRCRSDVRLSEASRVLLRTCDNTALASTAEAVRDNEYDGYQELLLAEMPADLTAGKESLLV